MKRRSALLGLLLVLHGCGMQQPTPFMFGDFQLAKELPYDSPPQVIYRIDSHRYLTLERYRDCNHGETFYNDTKQGIRKKLGRGSIENFQGRLINADPTGQNLVFPSSGPPQMVCNDRGCSVSLLYSTDGGRSFFAWVYMRAFDPFKDSAKFTIIATDKSLYVAEQEQYDVYVRKYPLDPLVDLSKPYPSGFRWEQGRESRKSLLPRGLRSPSGQERFSCDPSIRPTNPDANLTDNPTRPK